MEIGIVAGVSIALFLGLSSLVSSGAIEDIEMQFMASLNQYSQKSLNFDLLVSLIAMEDFLKGGILIAGLWYLWFKGNDQQHKSSHAQIVTLIVTVLITAALARVLAHLLPYRPRPMHTPDLNFLVPFGIDPTLLNDWSSFPSDHSVMFYTLATGTILCSRRIGAFMFAYVTVFICLPRIYLGFHWPTDIIAGMLIGISIPVIVHISGVRILFQRPLNWVLTRYPALFYATFFMVTYQVVVLFESIRHLVFFVFTTVQRLI